MRARRLIENAPYDPDQLKTLGKVFDDAWERIAPSISTKAKAIETARFALADVVLFLAKRGSFDAQWIADTAVRLMIPPPIAIPSTGQRPHDSGRIRN
jgi:hypothetical protein